MYVGISWHRPRTTDYRRHTLNLSYYLIFDSIGMKYVFEIATEPTIHVAISIIIVILSSFAFTKNVIMSGDPHVGIFSTTMLGLILWLVLVCLPSFLPKSIPKPKTNQLSFWQWPTIKSKNHTLQLITMRGAMTGPAAAVATHTIEIASTIIIPPGNSVEKPRK